MRNIYQSIVLLIAFSFVSLTSLAQTQTGPGGVGTSSTISIWLNASELGLANGASVTNWTDESGNGNNFTNGAFTAPTFVSSSASLGNRNAVAFTEIAANGSTGTALNSGSIASLSNDNSISWFSAGFYTAASNTTPAHAQVLHGAKYASNAQSIWTNYYSDPTNVLVSSVRGTPSSANSIRAFSTSAFVSGGIWQSNTLTEILNGTFTAAIPNANHSPTTLQYIRLGAHVNGLSHYTGHLGEFIVYNTPLNRAQSIIVSNYLNAKYNIAMSANSKYSFGSTHGLELAGIGREDASNEHLAARGTGIIEVTSSSLDDGDYLLWAHDNGALTTTTTNVPTDYTTTSGERISRIWRFGETGETDDITITFDLTGIEFADEFDYHLFIDSDGDFTNATLIDGVPNGSIISFSVDGSQLSNGAFVTIGSGQKLIRSITPGDWNQTTTWDCACIPAAPFAVYITDGNPVDVSDNQTVERIIIDPSSQLTLLSGASLSVSGNVTNMGTISSDISGLITLNGTSSQLIDGGGTNNLGSLTLNNALGVTFSSCISTLTDVLTLSQGAIDFGNTLFTFASSASGTASIGVIGGTASVTGTGNMRVQRFIAGGDAGYRNIGTPLTSMPLSEWDDEIFISGPGFPDGCAFSSAGCFLSARYWRSDLQAYRGFADVDSMLLNGFGLELFLGDNLTSFGANTLTSFGTPNFSQSTNITVRNQWNLISNPFLSPIDYDNVIKNGSTGNYFYVINPSTNQFEYWDGDAADASVSNFDNGIISPFQGFWVFHSGATSTLTFNQSSKSVGSTDLFFKNHIVNQNTNALQITLIDDQKTTDCKIKIGSIYSNSIDEADIRKLPFEINPNMAVFTLSNDSVDLKVNSINESENCFFVPILVDVTHEGIYNLKFDNLPEQTNVFLMDNVLGTKSLIKNGKTIAFQAYENELLRINRFSLLFENNLGCGSVSQSTEKSDVNMYVDNTDLNINIEGEQNDYSVQIVNLLGQNILNSTVSNISKVDISELNSGVYLVNILTIEGVIIDTKKIFVK